MYPSSDPNIYKIMISLMVEGLVLEARDGLWHSTNREETELLKRLHVCGERWKYKVYCRLSSIICNNTCIWKEWLKDWKNVFGPIFRKGNKNHWEVIRPMIPRLYSYLFLYLTGSLMLFSASGISQDDQLKWENIFSNLYIDHCCTRVA